MEVHKAIVIGSWNAKLLGVTIFSVPHFAKLSSKNDKGNRSFWSIQGKIFKSLKCKATTFLLHFYQHLIKNQR